MASNKQTIGKGFAILSTASIIVKLLSLLFVPLMINILGDKGYGVFGATYQVFAFIYIIANSGFPVAVSKFVSELSEQHFHYSALKSFKIARTFLIIIGLFFSILLAVLSRPIAIFMGFEEARLGLLVLAPSILITSILSAYRGYFQGRQNMIPTGVTQVIEQIVHIVFSSLFAYLWIKESIELGVAGSAIGTSVGALAALLIIIVFFKKYIKMGHAIPPTALKSKHSYGYLSKTLIRYSIPITISSAIYFGGNLIDAMLTKNRLLVSGLSNDIADVSYGFLNRYQQLINVPIALIIALAIAMLPAISASIAIHDRKSAQRKINYSFKLCYIVAIPAAFGLSILSEGIYSMLFFGDGFRILLFGAFTIIFTATVQIQTSILQSLNRLYLAVASLMTGILIKIVLNYFLISIPFIRVYGALIGTYVAMIITLTLNMYILRRFENVKVRLFTEASKPLASSFIMGAVLLIIYYPTIIFVPIFNESYFLNIVLVTFSIGIGGITYFVSMAKMGGITKNTLLSISPKIYKLLPKFMKHMVR